MSGDEGSYEDSYSSPPSFRSASSLEEERYEEARDIRSEHSHHSSDSDHSHHSRSGSEHSHHSSHDSGSDHGGHSGHESHGGHSGGHEGSGGMGMLGGLMGGKHGDKDKHKDGHGSGGGFGSLGKLFGGLKDKLKDKDKDKVHGSGPASGQGYATPGGEPYHQQGYQNYAPRYSHEGQNRSGDDYYSGPSPQANSYKDGQGGYAPPTEAFGAMALGGQTHGDQTYGGQTYCGQPNYLTQHSQGGYEGPGGNYNTISQQQEPYYPTGAGFNPQASYQAPQPPYGNQYRGDDDGQPHQQHFGPTFSDPQTGEVAQAYFEYSRCTGSKKALLIGINYFGTSGELAGCINDVHNVQKFICERFGYKPADIVILTDNQNDPRTMPTRDNIIRGMQWLVEGAKRDDSLFLHYSGHGTQADDLNGDEGDDDDEAICPVDYQSAGLIIDDDGDHDIVVKPLPAGCRLTAIFDSCHSGTVMDLPFVYTTEGKIKEPDLLSEAREGLLGAGMDILKGDTVGIMSNLFGAAKSVFDAKKSDEKTKKTRTSPADVIQWAGCKDSQTSADTEEEGKATGAMSYAFIEALTKYSDQSYQQLLTSVREEMKGRYTQIPQLSACHPIDTDLQFVA